MDDCFGDIGIFVAQTYSWQLYVFFPNGGVGKYLPSNGGKASCPRGIGCLFLHSFFFFKVERL